MKIALLGAGYSLEKTATLLDQGKIILTARTEERVTALRAKGFNVEQLNIADQGAVSSFFSRYPEIDVVVDGIPPLVGESSKDPLLGVRNIINGLNNLVKPLKRLIYLSTTGVYGVDDGSWVDEERTENPQTVRGRNRLESEKLYRSFSSEVVALRIAAIYGPERSTIDSLRAGRYPYLENGSRWSNRIHVDDLAQIIAAAILYPEKLPQALNIADDCPTLSKDLIEYCCKKYNLPMPSSMTQEEARAKGLETLLSNQRISNKKVKQILNLKLYYPSFREAL